MLDIKDIEKFYKLPSEFNSDGMAEIKTALQEYEDYSAYIVGMLEEHGGDAEAVETEIKWRKSPNQHKLLAVLFQNVSKGFKTVNSRSNNEK